MKGERSLSAALVDPAMSHYFRRAIPVSKDIDEVWHAWILQTQEYIALCEKLPTGRYIHHSSNDYLSFFDPLVGESDGLEPDVKAGMTSDASRQELDHAV